MNNKNENSIDMIYIYGKKEYIKMLESTFRELGLFTRLENFQMGYNFNLDDISMLIVAFLGGNGINSIITAVINRHQKDVDIKFDKGKLKEIHLKTNMREEGIRKLIQDIRDMFTQNE